MDNDLTPLYSVRNWNEIYENSESRKLKSCRYVCTPNKHDGAGYGRMMNHEHAERLFAAWNAIVQVASKLPNRGILNAGREIPGSPGKFSREPLTAEDLAFRTRLKPDTFRIALHFFSSPQMAWLDCDKSIPVEKEEFRDNLPESPGVPGNVGSEGKGREGNRREHQEGVFAREDDEMGKKKNPVQEELIPDSLQANPEFMENWKGFLDMRIEIKKPATELAQKILLRKLRNISGEDVGTAIVILENSIVNSWQDIYPLKGNQQINGRSYSPAPGPGMEPITLTGED